MRDTPTQLMALWRCFVLVVVRRSPTADDAAALTDALARLAERGHEHAAIVHCAVVAGAGDPPGEAARERYRVLMTDPASICRGSAIVIEQEGFVGAIIRSVLTSLMFLTRAVYPTRAHGSKPAAAEWLLALLRQQGCDCIVESHGVGSARIVPAVQYRPWGKLASGSTDTVESPRPSG